MIRPDQIPDEVVEAAALAAYEEERTIWDESKQLRGSRWVASLVPWDQLAQRRQQAITSIARSTIAAAINAWPESHWVGDFGLHLPVPSEGGELESLGPEFEAAWDANVDRLYEFDKPEGEA